MNPNHKRMARVMGYALVLHDADAWLGFAKVATARMSEEERAALAIAALLSLPPARAEQCAADVLQPALDPLPAFLGGMEDARHWASYASTAELKAYALAAHDALTVRDQIAFRQHISEVDIAA